MRLLLLVVLTACAHQGTSRTPSAAASAGPGVLGDPTPEELAAHPPPLAWPPQGPPPARVVVEVQVGLSANVDFAARALAEDTDRLRAVLAARPDWRVRPRAEAPGWEATPRACATAAADPAAPPVCTSAPDEDLVVVVRPGPLRPSADAPPTDIVLDAAHPAAFAKLQEHLADPRPRLVVGVDMGAGHGLLGHRGEVADRQSLADAISGVTAVGARAILGREQGVAPVSKGDLRRLPASASAPAALRDAAGDHVVAALALDDARWCWARLDGSAADPVTVAATTRELTGNRLGGVAWFEALLPEGALAGATGLAIWCLGDEGQPGKVASAPIPPLGPAALRPGP
jgi:hypothetical protein